MFYFIGKSTSDVKASKLTAKQVETSRLSGSVAYATSRNWSVVHGGRSNNEKVIFSYVEMRDVTDGY